VEYGALIIIIFKILSV